MKSFQSLQEQFEREKEQSLEKLRQEQSKRDSSFGASFLRITIIEFGTKIHN